jgi:predicted XRE-type DNA-binding protein
MSTPENTTVVETVDIDLDNILGIPGADSIMLPEEKKPNVFSTGSADTKFLDNPIESSNDSDKEKEDKTSFTDVLKDVDENDASLLNQKEEEEQKKTPGRSKISKDGTVELVKKLIDAGQIIPFDDEKSIDEYSITDFEELFQANFEERENKIRESTPAEFFQSLPEELQVAAKYVSDGGQDLKGLFKILAQVEETFELDPSDASHQEKIVREYLTATNFGTAEDIEEEIESWKDRGDLESKANKFKPKLDQMQAQVVQQKLAQQEQLKQRQAAQAQKYMQNVYETLKPGEINGVKIDRRTQEMLYAGLVQPQYPSISGRPTNMLGHLLEKYQYVEPNHGLIAEALWLLADPESYKTKIKEQGQKETVEKTARMLKTEEARRTGNSAVVEKEEVKQKTIKRNNNFFKR